MNRDWSLLAIADLSVLPAERVTEAALAATRGGATAVELRGKELTAGDLLALADRLGPALAERGVPLIINDRADVAAMTGAAGVHLGDHDLGVEAARTLLGAGAVVGRTARTVATANEAAAVGASYIGAGSIFPGGSKPGVPIIGLEGLQAIAAASALPVIAIGGIDVERAISCIESGAAGVAVIGALFSGGAGTTEIERRARALRSAVEMGRRAREA